MITIECNPCGTKLTIEAYPGSYFGPNIRCGKCNNILMAQTQITQPNYFIPQPTFTTPVFPPIYAPNIPVTGPSTYDITFESGKTSTFVMPGSTTIATGGINSLGQYPGDMTGTAVLPTNWVQTQLPLEQPKLPDNVIELKHDSKIETPEKGFIRTLTLRPLN
jgi:hypothetical protein